MLEHDNELGNIVQLGGRLDVVFCEKLLFIGPKL